MTDTTRLVLPLIAAAQAQKHVTHNEAILRLDGLVQMTAISYTTSAEPGSPSDGDLYLLPAGKTGTDWGTYANHAIAHYFDGIWHQYAPNEGWLCFVQDTGQFYYYTGSAWSLVPASAVVGTSTNDDAAAGYVGEYVETLVSVSSPVSVTSAVAANISSISLTAGDWDVFGVIRSVPTGGAQTTLVAGAANTASATLPDPGIDSLPCALNQFTSPVGGGNFFSFGPGRIKLSATTTVYFIGRADFASGSVGLCGWMAARRVR